MLFTAAPSLQPQNSAFLTLPLFSSSFLLSSSEPIEDGRFLSCLFRLIFPRLSATWLDVVKAAKCQELFVLNTAVILREKYQCFGC